MSMPRIVTKSRKKPIAPGDRFGSWMILKKASGWTRWHVRCDCGTEKTAHSGHLFSGQTKSCGCLRDELASLRRTKHGEHKSPEYKTWLGIRRRCHNPTDKDYPSYGGRGIGVCERWRGSFTAFLEDMGRKPTLKHTIERRDNAAGYSPENCCWATAKQQSENRRSSQHVFLAGEILTVAEAARRIGRHRSAVWNYATRLGVTRQEAVDHFASKKASLQ